MTRDDLVRWLDDYLDIAAWSDPSLNGLQVEGRDEVAKVAVAVDSSLSTFEQAADMGADLLIVHHGVPAGAMTDRMRSSRSAIGRARRSA